MKPFLRKSLLAVAAAAVCLTSVPLLAQQAPGRDRGARNADRPQRGDFDPAQMQQRMLNNLRERLGVTDDAEWKIISDRIAKVMEARRQVGFGGGLRFGRPLGDGPGADAGRGRRGFFGATASPEAEALQRAIESKASREELKAAMAKYRKARRANEEQLRQAQEELRQVLTVEQEAIALQMGLVN